MNFFKITLNYFCLIVFVAKHLVDTRSLTNFFNQTFVDKMLAVGKCWQKFISLICFQNAFFNIIQSKTLQYSLLLHKLFITILFFALNINYFFQHYSLLSTINVTGPSFFKSTNMSAPNFPV